MTCREGLVLPYFNTKAPWAVPPEAPRPLRADPDGTRNKDDSHG